MVYIFVIKKLFDIIKNPFYKLKYMDKIEMYKNNITTFIITNKLENIINDIKNIFGKEPEENLIGMNYDGSPIFAFTIYNKIVSDIGFSITHDKYGNKIINLINLKIEK